MSSRIRFAEISDAPSIQALYAPFCESTVVSFEIKPPTVEEMVGRIERISVQHPWLVCERDGTLAGYVYACQHRERAAYRWAVDVTVYVRPDQQRRGIGRALYSSLFAILREQGYKKAYAGITLPNAGSVGLHEAMGFRPMVVYPSVGFKLGEWRDVGWWQLELAPAEPDPAEPVAISSLRSSPHVLGALTIGKSQLRD